MPVVSIKCITYQHVNFIRDAIEGFLMQETTFPVEILIHDDASTDGTADIVREYQAKYPQLIRAVLQTENQWSKGIKPMKFLSPLALGEFIALCEGDDYWTSPHKLQIQVDCLRGNPDFVISHHVVSYQNNKSGAVVQTFPPTERRLPVAEGKDLLWSNFIQTCSIVYRCSALSGIDVASILHGLALGDWPLCVILCQRGKICFCDSNMAVYRIHATNYWYQLPAETKAANIEFMSLRLAQKLEYRHALPWFDKIAQAEFSEFYRTSLHGDVRGYPFACCALLRRSASFGGSFVVRSAVLSVKYALICLRERARRCRAR